MYNRIIEFTEFSKLRDEFSHQKHWENEYRSHTKEMLLNQLLEQQECNYPLMNEGAQKNKQFHALINILEEKSSTPWLKQILQGLRENVVDVYRKFSDRSN
jgi:hypothetical protein